MARHRISASALIPAPAEHVYAVIADYRDGHPRILPKPPFVALTVVKGGFGAGTEIELEMRLMGTLQTYRGVVTEPAPGRVIVETYRDRNVTTTFTIEPRDGDGAYVTIATELEMPGGLLGLGGRWLANRLLRRTYEKELRQLTAVAGA